MKLYRLGAIAAIGLLAACGGGDDAEPAAGNDGTVEPAEEPAAEPAEEPADEPAAAPADDAADDANNADDASSANDANDADDGAGSSAINSLDDIPQECRQIVGDFLREVEPMVKDIDWQNATLSDLEALGDSIDAPASDIEVDMDAAGCDDIDFDGDDEAGFELAIELARQEAPGVVGWLEFIRDASQSFDVSAEGGGDQTVAAPETCDEALAAVRALMEESESMMELPVDEVMAAGTTISNITTVCGIDEMSALFEDPDFIAWTDG